MGFFIGLGHAIPARRAQLTLAAWAVPVLLHGVYDLGVFIGITRLWLMVFLVELAIANRMLGKLREIQQGRAHPEAVVRWAWLAVRRRLGLEPRELPLIAAAEAHPLATDPGVAEVPSDVDSQPPIGRRSDGSVCRHEGETSTYCTLCWTNIKPSTILSR
jgi:hypothetical protein